MSKTNVVPIGKYKGQPVEVLAGDRDYCDWLAAQPWFRKRYQDTYNIIINFGGPPEDSPEHNAMTAKFLDYDYMKNFVEKIQGKGLEEGRSICWPEFEVDGWDIAFKNDGEQFFVECKPTLGDEFPAVLRQIKARRKHDYPRHLKQRPLCSDVCLVGRFVTHGVEKLQLIDMFDTSYIILLEEDDLKKTHDELAKMWRQ